MNIEQHVESFLSKYCTKEASILVAVSGGSDSMALLNILYRLNYNISVAHCNFGLRGKESDEDEYLVVTYCLNRNIPYHTKFFNTKSFCESKKLGIQEGARILRYNWFDELCANHSFDFVLTAHHLNDTIETFLFNLARGNNVQSLKGIPKQRNNILRPLLEHPKKDINNYCAEYNIEYRTDSSNSSDKYSRNLIRNHVIPKLVEVNSQAMLHIENAITNIELLTDISKTYLSSLENKYVVKEDTKTIININQLKNEEKFCQFFLENFLFSFHFNNSQVNEMISAKTSGKLWKSSSHEILYNRGCLHLSLKTTFLTQIEPVVLDCISNQQYININGQMVQFEFISEPISSFNKGSLYLDFDKITFPITIRKWNLGDQFSPLGMNGRKKISDYLIDKKIDLLSKEHVLVIEDQNRICGLISLVICNRVKITNRTKSVLRITVL